MTPGLLETVVYANKQHRPAKLSVGDGEPVAVLVSLTQKHNAADGRGHIEGFLQSHSWPSASENTRVYNLLLEDGRELEIVFQPSNFIFPFIEDSDEIIEANFMESKSMKA
ncbi:MAG: hypothetical protein O7C75_17000 [Verrucomicrobia bacterium]|nr:hypothetical protein [Verrucomicrobiota bacterium]